MAAKEASFDVVSEYDAQELKNAIDQARREISTRFDLKDLKIEIEPEKEDITVTADSEFVVQNVIQIMEDKAIKRGMSPFLFDSKTKPAEAALGGRSRQVVLLKTGIDQALAKQIVNEIKAQKMKVQTSIQGEQVRVTGKSRDDLQEVIALLKEKSSEWEAPLQYQNFR